MYHIIVSVEMHESIVENVELFCLIHYPTFEVLVRVKHQNISGVVALANYCIDILRMNHFKPSVLGKTLWRRQEWGRMGGRAKTKRKRSILVSNK